MMVRRKSVRAADSTAPHPSLAEKLDRLFQTKRSPNGREYTYAEVATGITVNGIAAISAAYLCDLRNGTKENPRIKHLEALAAFFDVPVTYFLDEDEAATRMYAQLIALPAQGNSGLQRIMLRAVDLSPETLEAMAQILEHARQIEGAQDRKNARPKGDFPVSEAGNIEN